MSAVTAAAAAPIPTTGSISFAPPADAPRYEHLHLHLRRTHWETKYHPDLGRQLQDALDVLDGEGWEVVTAFVMGQTTEVILRRPVVG